MRAMQLCPQCTVFVTGGNLALSACFTCSANPRSERFVKHNKVYRTSDHPSKDNTMAPVISIAQHVPSFSTRQVAVVQFPATGPGHHLGCGHLIAAPIIITPEHLTIAANCYYLLIPGTTYQTDHLYYYYLCYQMSHTYLPLPNTSTTTCFNKLQPTKCQIHVLPTTYNPFLPLPFICHTTQYTLHIIYYLLNLLRTTYYSLITIHNLMFTLYYPPAYL